jgi:hypothetical protein
MSRFLWKRLKEAIKRSGRKKKSGAFHNASIARLPGGRRPHPKQKLQRTYE